MFLVSLVSQTPFFTQVFVILSLRVSLVNKHTRTFPYSAGWRANETVNCLCADGARGSHRVPARDQDELGVSADPLQPAAAHQGRTAESQGKAGAVCAAGPARGASAPTSRSSSNTSVPSNALSGDYCGTKI